MRDSIVGAQRARVAPGVLLFLVAIGGRFTFARAGVTALGNLDLRLVGLLVAISMVVADLAARKPRRRWGRAEAWVPLAGGFFCYQILSQLWAPPGARAATKATDIALMALLTLTVYVYARSDSGRAIRVAFWFSYVAAIVWALGALATGPGLQNRYAAFGGGPNVFVRIEVIGIIAAVVLRNLGASRWVLAPIPLLVGASLLSGSRGGLVAAALIGLVVGAVRRVWLSPRLVVGVVGLAVILTLAMLRYLPPGIHELVGTRYGQQTFATHYLSARPQIWGQTLTLAEQHPVIGVGLDGFYAQVGAAEGVEYPHNYALAVLAEQGTVGVTLLGLVAVTWLMSLRGSCRNRREVIACVTVAGYVALSSLTSGDNYDSRMAWIFAALAAAAAAQRASPPDDSSVRGTPRHATSREEGSVWSHVLTS